MIPNLGGSELRPSGGQDSFSVSCAASVGSSPNGANSHTAWATAGRGGGAAMTCGRRAAKIVLLTGNGLCHNPRAFKAATALGRAGHDVQVLGAWLEPELRARDQKLIEGAPFRFVPVLDGTRYGAGAAAAQMFRRARSKTANVLHALTGRESAHQLGLSVRAMMAYPQVIEADLFIARFGARALRQLRRCFAAADAWASTWRTGFPKT